MRIAIVGAGPAGIFCAFELARNGADVTVFERGHSLENRVCPDHDCRSCCYGMNCAILCGEGGAGGYSDGKVTLSSTRGVQLSNELDFKQFEGEIQDVDEICTEFAKTEGIPSSFFNPVPRPDFIEGTDFQFESYPLRFFSTSGIRRLMNAIRKSAESYGAKFLFNTQVDEIFYLDESKPVTIVGGLDGGFRTSDFFDFTILANGGFDRPFMRQLALTNNIQLTETGPAGFGIRLEADTQYLERMMSQFYDYKLYMEAPFQEMTITLRSFCVNRDGSIVNENRATSGIVSINGRSESKATGRSNLAIMSRIPDGKQMVRDLAAVMNDNGLGLPIYQPAGEFFGYSDNTRYVKYYLGTHVPRRNAARANIASLMPSELRNAFQRYLTNLERIMPGCVTDMNSLVYAPEIKYHMPRWPLGEGFVVKGAPLFQVIGNAAGYTDSISTAAVMGLVAARYRIDHN